MTRFVAVAAIAATIGLLGAILYVSTAGAVTCTRICNPQGTYCTTNCF